MARHCTKASLIHNARVALGLDPLDPADVGPNGWDTPEEARADYAQALLDDLEALDIP